MRFTKQKGLQNRRVTNREGAAGNHQHPLSTECGRSTKATAFVGTATTLGCWTQEGYRSPNRRHACRSASRCKCLESYWHHAPSLCLSNKGCQAGCCWSSTAFATALPAFDTASCFSACGLHVGKLRLPSKWVATMRSREHMREVKRAQAWTDAAPEWQHETQCCHAENGGLAACFLANWEEDTPSCVFNCCALLACRCPIHTRGLSSSSAPRTINTQFHLAPSATPGPAMHADSDKRLAICCWLLLCYYNTMSVPLYLLQSLCAPMPEFSCLCD